MAQLEARKELLEAQRIQAEDAKMAVHLNMARIYRERRIMVLQGPRDPAQSAFRCSSQLAGSGRSSVSSVST